MHNIYRDKEDGPMFEAEIMATKDRLLALAREFQRVAVGPHACAVEAASDDDFLKEWESALGERVTLIRQEAERLQDIHALLRGQPPLKTEDLARVAIDLADISASQVEWTVNHIDSIRRAGMMNRIAVETTHSFIRGGDYLRDACLYAQGRLTPS